MRADSTPRPLMLTLSLLVALTALLAPDVALSKRQRKGAVWRANRVVVRDHTGEGWDITAMVAAYNAILPRQAPTLIYRQMPEEPCGKRLRTKRPRKSIVVCLHPEVGYPGLTRSYGPRWARHTVTIEFWGPMHRDQRANTVCHEFMHALTGAPEHWRGAGEQTSCLAGGSLVAPGPADQHFAKRVYRRYDRQWRRHRRHR